MFTRIIGVHDNYLLVGFGAGTAALEALGGGTPLIDRPELKPVSKFSDRRLTSISYSSKEAVALMTRGKKDVEEGCKWLADLVKESRLPEEKQDTIRKD